MLFKFFVHFVDHITIYKMKKCAAVPFNLLNVYGQVKMKEMKRNSSKKWAAVCFWGLKLAIMFRFPLASCMFVHSIDTYLHNIGAQFNGKHWLNDFLRVSLSVWIFCAWSCLVSLFSISTIFCFENSVLQTRIPTPNVSLEEFHFDTSSISANNHISNVIEWLKSIQNLSRQNVES